jgi:hypothetical protein
MFFARAELEFGDFIPRYAPTVMDNGTDAVGYIDSDSSYRFDAVTESDFTLTAVPGTKTSVPRNYPDGRVVDSYVRYQDPHVLRLPRGMGYLMVLGAYVWEADAEDDVGNPLADNCFSYIVGYWSAEPTFEDCKGPFWLVSRNQDVGTGTVVPVWLGVPSAVILNVAGVEYLYIYFVAEASDYGDDDASAAVAAGFLSGTWVRRMRLRGFMETVGEEYVRRERERVIDPWHPFTEGFEVGDPDNLDMTPSASNRTDEAEWDPASENFLLRGENLGKVKVWVATGYQWPAGGGMTLSIMNTEFEEYYWAIKIVDPVAVVSNQGGSGQRLMLYFSANSGDNRSPDLVVGYGAWCAVAVPEDASDEYGTDFVVADGVDITTDVGESSLLSAGSLDENERYMAEGRLDPDPAELPDRTWVVNVGAVTREESKTGTANESIGPMLRIEGGAADGAPDPSFPWE